MKIQEKKYIIVAEQKLGATTKLNKIAYMIKLR